VIRPATPDDIAEVRSLFREYAASLSVDLCFQNFEKELAELPGVYDPILLCLGGCVALRPLSATTAEMKRLYVRPQHRGQGLGRKLIEAIIAAAIERGYHTIRLDTLPEMRQAIAIYRRMGFQEIAPYCNNPIPGALFMELKVESPGRITGIGGVFFKSPDHKALRSWYQENLGLKDGAMVNQTAWSIFPSASDYFASTCMINYTVDDLDAFLAKCAAAGVRIDPKRDEADYGRFAWIYDPDGNKIELWQPA
jgi:GNAT superfamily N-acetyltransferase